MALGQQRKKTYLSINHGKIVRGTGENKEFFSFVEGNLKGIYLRNSFFGNEEVKRWYIDIQDGEELYSLCLPFSSGAFKSIILALASYEGLTKSTRVTIRPYEGGNGYTKVVVLCDGTKMDWITKQLPPQEVVTIGTTQVRDDSKQMETIISFCEIIKTRLRENIPHKRESEL